MLRFFENFLAMFCKITSKSIFRNCLYAEQLAMIGFAGRWGRLLGVGRRWIFFVVGEKHVLWIGKVAVG